MKKMMLYTALATLLSFSTAHAIEIVIDDFSTPQGPISDLVVNGIAVTNLIPLLGLPVTNRTLNDNLIASSVPVQNSVEVTAGILDVTNGTGEDSQVMVIWTLTPGL